MLELFSYVFVRMTDWHIIGSCEDPVCEKTTYTPSNLPEYCVVKLKSGQKIRIKGNFTPCKRVRLHDHRYVLWDDETQEAMVTDLAMIETGVVYTLGDEIPSNHFKDYNTFRAFCEFCDWLKKNINVDLNGKMSL